MNQNRHHGNICRESTEENDEEKIVLQSIQQGKESHKQPQQQNGPDIQIEDSSKNEPYIIVFKRSFKGANAEHEIIYRVKLSKDLLPKNASYLP